MEQVVDILEEILGQLKEANSTLERLESEVCGLRGVGLYGDSLGDVCDKLEEVKGTGVWNSLSDIYDKLEGIQGSGP